MPPQTEPRAAGLAPGSIRERGPAFVEVGDGTVSSGAACRKQDAAAVYAGLLRRQVFRRRIRGPSCRCVRFSRRAGLQQGTGVECRGRLRDTRWGSSGVAPDSRFSGSLRPMPGDPAGFRRRRMSQRRRSRAGGFRRRRRRRAPVPEYQCLHYSIASMFVLRDFRQKGLLALVVGS